MPVPVIYSPPQILTLVKDEAMRTVQLVATESPSSWTVSGTLPTGISHSSGGFTGTPTVLESRVITIKATNASGDSRIEAIAFHVYDDTVTETGDMLLDYDLPTDLLTSPEGVDMLFAQYQDKRTLALGFLRGGALQLMTITNVKVRVMDDPTDDSTPAVELFDGDPLDPSASDTAPRYRISLDFDQAGIAAMCEAHRGDAPDAKIASEIGTPLQLAALMEIEVTYTTPDPDGSGSYTTTRTSKRFAIQLTKRLGASE